MPKRLFVLAAAFVLGALPALSQTNPTGTISGKVVDPQGLAVPGVTVTAEAPTLQGARSATTSVNGDYIITFLPPGDYTVTFALAGFATVKESARIAGSASIPINVTMALSTVTESVTVVAQAQGEFNQTAQVATSYKADLIEKLPVARTMQQAALLTPGVSNTAPPGPCRSRARPRSRTCSWSTASWCRTTCATPRSTCSSRTRCRRRRPRPPPSPPSSGASRAGS